MASTRAGSTISASVRASASRICRSKASGTGALPPSINATVRAIGEARPRPAFGGLREASRQRGEQRFGDRWIVLREVLIGRSRQRQHAGVANRDDIGGTRHVGEKADFADQLAGAEFGEWLGIGRCGAQPARHAAQ